MKKLHLMLATACVALFSLTSCASDDAPTVQPETTVDPLLGKWNAKSYGTKIEVNGTVDYDGLDADEMYGIILRYDFKADRTVDHYTFIPASNGKEEQESQGTTSYEKTGNQLKFGNSSREQVTVLLLDTNNLHLQSVTEFTVEEEHYKLTSLIKYVKM